VKVRSPKSEARRKSEGLSSNPEDQSACVTRLSSAAAVTTRKGGAEFLFGFRFSAFLRISDFGPRILVAALYLLAAQPSLAAATNPPTDGEIPALRPPHAELGPTYWEQHGVGIVVCVGLVLALVGVAIWLLARPKPPVVVPPEVLARKALEPLGQRSEDGALLSEVSHILHQYVTAAFNLPPIELTTTEFCRAIAGHEQIGPDLSTALSEFLQKCDQRKFSPPAPAPPLSVVGQALKLIDQAQARQVTLAQALK
jgi:hypothetical protein